MGELRWYIVGCYLAPGYWGTIQDVEVEMADRPMGEEAIVMGEFNVNMEGTDG